MHPMISLDPISWPVWSNVSSQFPWSKRCAVENIEWLEFYESFCWMCLGEEVRQLLVERNRRKENGVKMEMLVNKMAVYFNVFSALMKNIIVSNIDCTHNEVVFVRKGGILGCSCLEVGSRAKPFPEVVCVSTLHGWKSRSPSWLIRKTVIARRRIAVRSRRGLNFFSILKNFEQNIQKNLEYWEMP